ncbi:hypothetical protein UY3_03386 [Chelonia mydas]|uniref:Uncharacterized protein n=1 Tax=Chelonia mydas TaxID=8469 RepID=M7BQA2_CHEMY|nr:hypothetical protein UY3_03386 [Chelonia mydas]
MADALPSTSPAPLAMMEYWSRRESAPFIVSRLDAINRPPLDRSLPIDPAAELHQGELAPLVNWFTQACTATRVSERLWWGVATGKGSASGELPEPFPAASSSCQTLSPMLESFTVAVKGSGSSPLLEPFYGSHH